MNKEKKKPKPFLEKQNLQVIIVLKKRPKTKSKTKKPHFSQNSTKDFKKTNNQTKNKYLGK